jgi:hypothetical protein
LRRFLRGSSSAPGISPPKTRDPADDRALARTYLAAQAAIKRYLDSETVRDEAKAVLRFVYDGAFDDLSRRVAEKALLSIERSEQRSYTMGVQLGSGDSIVLHVSTHSGSLEEVCERLRTAGYLAFLGRLARKLQDEAAGTGQGRPFTTVVALEFAFDAQTRGTLSDPHSDLVLTSLPTALFKGFDEWPISKHLGTVLVTPQVFAAEDLDLLRRLVEGE